jgi:hypothetical protein
VLLTEYLLQLLDVLLRSSDVLLDQSLQLRIGYLRQIYVSLFHTECLRGNQFMNFQAFMRRKSLIRHAASPFDISYQVPVLAQ